MRDMNERRLSFFFSDMNPPARLLRITRKNHCPRGESVTRVAAPRHRESNSQEDRFREPANPRTRVAEEVRMIGSLSGVVAALGGDTALTEVGGVGYVVHSGRRTLAPLHVGAPARLFIHTPARPGG